MIDKNRISGRGDAGFSIPFLLVIFFGGYILFLSNVGKKVEDFGEIHQGTITYISREFFCIESKGQRFYLNGFSDQERDIILMELRKGVEINFYATEPRRNRSKVLQISIGDKILVPYSWWSQNSIAVIFVVIGIVLIPIVIIERRRIISRYGVSEDPSMLHKIVEIFRRYQKPHIDDK
jgi:hypothetical protein